MPLDNDPRSLKEVIGDADSRMAEAFAAATDTQPLRWFLLLQDGMPFRELNAMADALARQRQREAREAART
jgi:hypothetical protein